MKRTKITGLGDPNFDTELKSLHTAVEEGFEVFSA